MIESDQNTSPAILIIDEQPVFRFGLKQVLTQEFEAAEILESTHPYEANKFLDQKQIDFLVMTLKPGGKNGLQWISEVKKKQPQLGVMITGCHGKCPGIQAFTETGVSVLLPKACTIDELRKGLATLVTGGTLFLQGNSPAETADSSFKIPPAITKREREILQLIFQEHTNPEIAELLNISRRTVDTHRKNLLKKMNVKNTVGLIRSAMRMGLLILD